MKDINSKQNIAEWLSCKPTENTSYIHLLIKADGSQFPGELVDYFRNAHKEAQEKYINKILDLNLDPLGQPSLYTSKLPIKTLQGYLGEVLGGLIAINKKPFDKEWEIPIHLFSFHDTVFDWLDMYLQNAETSTEIVGRTGDDNLAFLRNENNEIISIMFIEAKCSLTHNAALINNAHSSLSKTNIFPVSRDKIKQLLKEKGDEESLKFVEAINNLTTTQKERFDMVSYAYGQQPQRNEAWIPQNTVNQHYTGKRKLVAAECNISDIENLIHHIYKEEDSNG